MDEAKNYLVRQIEISRQIINEYTGNDDYSMTMILNSLLSLIVLPVEQIKKKNKVRFFSGSMNEINNKLGFSPVLFQPIKCCDGQKIKYEKRDIYAYIRKLRNGVAHQNITVNENDNGTTIITFYNYYTCRNCNKCKLLLCKNKGLTRQYSKVVDYKISVSLSQLRRLARYISDSYIMAIEGE